MMAYDGACQCRCPSKCSSFTQHLDASPTYLQGYYGCFFTNYVFRMAGSGSGKAGGANKSVGGPMSLGTL